MFTNKNQFSRRVLMNSLASASMLLPAMLQEMVAAEASPGAAAATDPLAPKAPMFPAKAKRVIFLFMSGGASHVDTFDPKPRLVADHHKQYDKGFLHASPFSAKRYSSAEAEVTELFPHVGACMEDICLIRSMYNDIPNHPRRFCRSTVAPPCSPGRAWAHGSATVWEP